MTEALGRVAKALNSPELTASFQRYCGLYYSSVKRESAERIAMSNGVEPLKKPPHVAHKYRYLHIFLSCWSFVGDELFFILFLPLLFWNFDPWVGRRLVIMWSITLYVGQAAKDKICWTRPKCPPVIKVPDAKDKEYSMPSTHAVSSSTMAISLVVFTVGRYDYTTWIGWVVASAISLMVGLSRLYKGVHTVLDLLAGYSLTALVMAFGWFWIDHVDGFLIGSTIATAVTVFAVSLVALVFYPYEHANESTKADTTMAVSVFWGIFIGLQLSSDYPADSVVGVPFPVYIPGFHEVIIKLKRFLFGMIFLAPLRIVLRTVIYNAVGLLADKKKGSAEDQLVIVIARRFITYGLFTLAATCIAPKIFILSGVPIVPQS